MKTIVIGSFLVLFALVATFAATAPTAFADHMTASVSIPTGSGVPGCEDTNECYIPAEVTVDVGGEVTWTNDDSAAHTVTSGMPSDADSVGAMFDSGLLLAGSTYSQVFDEEGTVNYFCIVHPWMQGMVVVQAAMADNGAEEEEEHEELTVMVSSELADGGTQVNLEFNQLHVNYVITAKQNGETVFEETVHAMEMTASHMVDIEASEESPLDIEVVSMGVGPPGTEETWTGPIDEVVATKQVVPEFGTIAMMILAVSIISIIAVTAKTRVIPRL
jgi:predicted secreted protein with PEFG-CTERM motif